MNSKNRVKLYAMFGAWDTIGAVIQKALASGDVAEIKIILELVIETISQLAEVQGEITAYLEGEGGEGAKQ